MVHDAAETLYAGPGRCAGVLCPRPVGDRQHLEPLETARRPHLGLTANPLFWGIVSEFARQVDHFATSQHCDAVALRPGGW